MKEQIFLARHAERTDSPETGEQVSLESGRYEGLTDAGVERTMEQARDVLIDMIERSAKDAVVFVGGSSEEKRARSTDRIIADTLAEHFRDRPDVIVISPADMKEGNGTHFLNLVEKIISDNPEKRIIVNRPLFLKEFSLRPVFRDTKSGTLTELHERYYSEGNHTEKGATEAFMNDTETVRESARKQLQGIKRLRTFARSVVPERELIVGFVSHGWVLDALVSYLVNDGKAGREGFEKTGGKMIETSEIGTISIHEGGVKFEYRGIDYEIPLDILEPETKN